MLNWWRSPTRGDVHGAAPGIPLFTDVDELVAHGLDAAVVAVPTAFRETVCMKLAEAEVHSFIEKPMAADAVTGQRLVDGFASRGHVGAQGHIERFNPALQESKRRLEAGALYSAPECHAPAGAVTCT